MQRATRRFLLVAAASCLTATGAHAQLNPFAPPEAMDTLNGASVGGGVNPNTYIDRASNVAGGAGNPFGAAPGGNAFGTPAGADPFGGPAPGGDPFGGAGNSFGGAPGGDPFASSGAVDPFGQPGAADPFGEGGFQGGFNGQQQQQIPVPQLPTRARVLSGDRVYCAVTGRLLEDAAWTNVWTSDAEANFYDDGTHGDPVANDQYFSNIHERRDVVAPIVWRVLRETKKMVRTAELKDPLHFFGLQVATLDPQADDKPANRKIPDLMEREEDRDQRLEEWNTKFLRMYRKDPNDPQSDFYPPHIPPPPTAPDAPPPANFQPAAYEAFSLGDQQNGQPGQFGQVGSFDEFIGTAGGLRPGQPSSVTGIPANPAASSNYFSTTAVGAEGGSK